jgi:hypothetical protein
MRGKLSLVDTKGKDNERRGRKSHVSLLMRKVKKEIHQGKKKTHLGPLRGHALMKGLP